MAKASMPINRRSFRAAVSVLFLDNLGLSVVYPIFTPLVLQPIYALLPVSYSLAHRMILLGFLIASFPFMQFIGGPIMGHIADKKGRRFGFTVALVGEAIGFFLTGVGIAIKSYPLVLFSRLFSGFFAGNFTICLTTITDLHQDVKARAKDFGIVASVAGISFVIAIAIGGILSNNTLAKVFNSSLPFWIITALSLLNIGIIWKAFSETHHRLSRMSKVYKNQVVELFQIYRASSLHFLYPLFFFFMLGWIVSLQFLSSFLLEHFHGTKVMITTLFISVGIGWCISNMWFERILIRVFSPLKILTISLLLATICLFVASEVRVYYLFFHFILFGSIFASLVWTNCLALISKKAPNYLQGKLLGINQSVATLSMLIAPLFGGFIGEFDIRTIYLFASSSFLLSLLILFVFRNKINVN
ncbi:MAG: MFS transporter [Simkania sp.]|nr:MFS transporter [Simkania sp.]